jgi:hypothetical protein
MRLPPRLFTRRTSSIPRNLQNTSQYFKCPGNAKNGGGGGGNIAVLIDAENIQNPNMKSLMTEVAKHGKASVRRIYGDWTNLRMSTWKKSVLLHSLVPIQQFAHTSGKNSSNGAMMVDAMDLLYTGCFSHFALVTSDSDFTRLASRIREQGVTVLGFGNKHNTHWSFITACDEFAYLNTSSAQSEKKKEEATVYSKALLGDAGTAITTVTEPIITPAALDTLRIAITNSHPYPGEGSYVDLGAVGFYLLALSPGLTPYNWYGYSRLRDFALASGIVESKTVGSLTLVRLTEKRRDTITPSVITTEPPKPVPPPPPIEENPAITDVKQLGPAALESIRRAIIHLDPRNKEDPCVELPVLGRYLQTKLSPPVHFQDYGYPSLRQFVRGLGIVELERMNGLTFVRLKDMHKTITTTTKPLTPRPTSPFEETPPLKLKPIDQAALEAIRLAITKNLRGDEDSFVSLDRVSNDHLTRLSPNLHYRNYGYSRMSDFLEASGIVELRIEATTAWIRLKDRPSNALTTTTTTATEPPTLQLTSPFEKENPTPTTPGFKSLDQAAVESIRTTITKTLQDGEEDSFITLARFSRHYKAEQPDLHYRNYGFCRLSEFLLASGIVELKTEDTTTSVRLKNRRGRDTPITTATEDSPLVPIPFDAAALEAIRRAIFASPPYKGGSFVKISDVKNWLLEQSPDLTPGNYGYVRLRDFILASGIVEMHEMRSAVLVRLWDRCELGTTAKREKERKMRLMMMKDERGSKNGKPLTVKDGSRDYGLLRPLVVARDDRHRRETKLESEDARGHETLLATKDGHGHEHMTSLALVSLGDVHEHEMVLAKKDDHGTLPVLVSSGDSKGHEHETPLALKDERKNGQMTSSVLVSPKHYHGHEHEHEQQGIGMPLTLDYGPEPEPETSLATKDEHKPGVENGLETSSPSTDEPEPELESSLAPETEPEPEPEGKPETTPLASLARSFFFSESR